MSDDSHQDQALSQSSVGSQCSSEHLMPDAGNPGEPLAGFNCLWGGCSEFVSCLEELSIHIDEQHISKLSSRKNVSCKWTQCRRMEPFADITLLSQHIRSHTGEKPFMCSYKNCEARFAAKSNLIAHSKRKHGKIMDPIYLDPREQLKAGIRTTRELLMLETSINSSQAPAEENLPPKKFPKRGANSKGGSPNIEAVGGASDSVFQSKSGDELLLSCELENFFENLQFDVKDRQMAGIVYSKLDEVSSRLAQLDARLEQVKALDNEVGYLLAKYSAFNAPFPAAVVENLNTFKGQFALLRQRIESKIDCYTNIQESVKNKIFFCTLENLKIRYF